MIKFASLLLFTLLAHCLTDAVWVNEEFWTSVSSSGALSGGRTIADFAHIGHDTIFPALWITRTRYPGEHFEAFGFAYVRRDARVCGWFVGLNGETEEVCGGFRVLSVPERFRGQKVFEWVPASAGVRGTVGFSAHRIARRSDGMGNVTYGDAIAERLSFVGVQTYTHGSVELVAERHSSFLERVSLLKLLVDPRTAEDKLRDLRRPETASVLPPSVTASEAGRFKPWHRMYIPVEIVRDEYGALYERRIVEGRLYFIPFDPVEKRALTGQQVAAAHRAQHRERRHLAKTPTA